MFNRNETKPKSLLITILHILIPLISLGALLCVWLLAARATSGIIVPYPYDVFKRLTQLFVKPISNVSVFGHIFVSLRRVFIALFLAMLLGIPFGVLIGWNRTLYALFGTIFEMLRPIPAIAWMPVLVMWMGIGETSKVVMVFIGCFMPIVINSYTGIRLVTPLYLDVGKLFNASSNKKLLLQIAVPSALPAIFAGIRNATSLGWMVVLAAEMMGAKSGLGFLIIRGMESFDVPLIMTGMLLIGVVGALLAILTNYIERWVCPWNQALKSD